MKRPTALLLAIGLAATACGGEDPGTSGTSTAGDEAEAAALEFAVSARRAVESTRFADLGDGDLARLVLELCEDLGASSDPDGDVVAFVADLEAPSSGAGDEADDRIMAVVLAEGALAACPDTVDDASLRAWEAAAPEDRFLAAVQSVSPDLDVDPAADLLLEAGAEVCAVLDGGGTAEDAIAAEVGVLFGDTGITVGDLASGGVGEREGVLAGGVLGGAATFLCPEHREVVLAYLEGLAGEDG